MMTKLRLILIKSKKTFNSINILRNNRDFKLVKILKIWQGEYNE